MLYLDPPYNTGDKDWAYNNDFMGKSDVFRPSKWLAFMERRLILGRRLLKPDGVMVVTIDEHEVHHLGMLLEQMFPEAVIEMATIVIASSGASGHLSRADEYAFFCFFGDAPRPTALGEDFLTGGDEVRERSVRWRNLLRSGNHAAREERPRLFYPVLIDPVENKIVGFGEPLIGADPDLAAPVGGMRASWPIRGDGSWGSWSNRPETCRKLLSDGFLKLGQYDDKRKTWSVLYLNDKVRKEIASGQVEVSGRDDQGAVVAEFAHTPRLSVKTVWHRGRHNAGDYGSTLLNKFLGGTKAFSFPKSLYAVRDTLDILTHDKPDALIVDFFAGSGTTLHATVLLNADDDGHRRSILVTNNDVRAEDVLQLNADRVFRGDPAFESRGIFAMATVPRITAAVTGTRPDGKPVEGTYLDGREYSEGFEENVEFFRLKYLDPMLVEMGRSFVDLHPLLWLAAGGVGKIEDLDPAARYAVPAGSHYAVLFHPAGVPKLLAALKGRPDVNRVFIAAHSDSSFSELSSVMPVGVEAIHFQQKFLDTLRGAVL